MSQISPINELIPLTSSDTWYMPRVALFGIQSDAPCVFYTIAINLPYSDSAPIFNPVQQANTGDPGDNPNCLFLDYEGDLPDDAPDTQMTVVIVYAWANVTAVPDLSGPGGALYPPVYLKVKDPKHKGVVKTGIGIHTPFAPNAPLYESAAFVLKPILPNSQNPQQYFVGALTNILDSDNYQGPLEWNGPTPNQLIGYVQVGESPVTTCHTISIIETDALTVTDTDQNPSTISIEGPTPPPPYSTFDYGNCYTL